MYGGRIATFDATYTGTKSFTELGLVNYKCDINANCPNRFAWYDKFFSGVTNYADVQWGWMYTVAPGKYHCASTVWYNTLTGNAGDIVCS